MFLILVFKFLNPRVVVRILMLVLFFSLIRVLASGNAQQDYSPQELALTVYSDGVVRVEYSIKLDVTSPQVAVVLFGTVYEDLIVEDENGLPLDSFTIENGINVYSLGASSAKITYFTSDLTNKSARFWVLTLISPTNSTIILPEDATIISLNQVPRTIGNLNGHSILNMPNGDQQITYIIGIVGTREYAHTLINEVDAKIEEIKAGEVIVTDAEAKLQEAKDALNRGQNTEAEQLAKQAQDLAIQTEALAIEASNTIRESESSIETAQIEGRTIGLDTADATLKQATDRYDTGEYHKALALAVQARSEAENATAPQVLSHNIYLWILFPAIIAVIISLFAFSIIKRSKRVVIVDAKEIFKQHPQIRYDDREIILYLSEKRGEALEKDIRDKFHLPRTTSWRMVKRLQREDIIEIHKVGGQNLLKIKSKYYTYNK